MYKKYLNKRHEEDTVFYLMAQVRRHEEKAALYLDAFNDNNHCAGALLQLFTEKGVVSLHIPDGFELGVVGEFLQELAEYHVTQARKILIKAFEGVHDQPAAQGADTAKTAEQWAKDILNDHEKPPDDPAE
jgi:hypothetical protein